MVSPRCRTAIRVGVCLTGLVALTGCIPQTEPTELFQLQGELARRNFDALVSFGSKRTEAWVKLYNDAFAPISNRVSVAAEKISKAA